jgi:hypothetical protein
MKVVKTLVLTLILACVAHAGDMPQWDPASAPAPPPAGSHGPTNNAGAKILLSVIQSLLSLR